MSHTHEEEPDVIDTIEEDPVEVPEDAEEETVITNTFQPSTESYSTHPKIKQILRNPEVKEVRLRFKRGRQLYVCIIFLDGSSIERPLRDIEDEEEPVCPTREPTVSRRGCREGGSGRERGGMQRRGGGEIEPRRSRWRFLGMKNRGQSTDIASIVENNENITVKRVVTIVRKGCGCENGETDRTQRRRRRVPVEYESNYEY